jgi:serine/threonine-protein kinase RsbW
MQVVTRPPRGNIAVVLSGGSVCVETPGEIAYRYVILRAVAAACKVAITRVCGRRVSAEGFTHQVVSAVGEAFNNIALHCYRDRPSDIVRVRMTIEAGVMRLTIEDYGASFDPLTAQVPDLDALPESGLGIYIMRSLMDEVTYQPGRPNVLNLSKRICECPGELPKVSGKRTTHGLLHE